MIEFLEQFLNTVASPQGAFETVPHSASWITFFQDALRSYRTLEITYFLGVVLILIALLKTAYEYMMGYRVARQVVSIGVATFLFAAFVTPPRNECLPDTGYPCLVEKTLVLKEGPSSISYVEEEIDWLKAQQGNNVYVVKNSDRNVKVTSKNFSNIKYVSYEYKEGFTPAWNLIEGLWWTSYQAANTALASMVAKYSTSANETKRTLYQIISTTFAASTAKGALDDILPFLGKTRGAGRVATASLGGALGAATEIPLAMITNSVRTMAILIATAPLALILTYHVMSALSGFILYLVIFLAPIFVGLSALFGMSLLSLPSRLLVSVFFIPVLAATILGTSLHLIYQYTDDVKNFVVNSDHEHKDSSVADFYSDASGANYLSAASPLIAYYLTQLAAYQLSNLYVCLRDGGFLVFDTDGTIKYAEPARAGNLDQKMCGNNGAYVRGLMNGNAPVQLPFGQQIPNLVERMQLMLPAYVSKAHTDKDRFVAELYSLIGLGTAEGSNPSALASPVGRVRLSRFLQKWGVVINAHPLTFNSLKKFTNALADQFGIRKEDKDKFHNTFVYLIGNMNNPGYIQSYFSQNGEFWTDRDTDAKTFVSNLLSGKMGRAYQDIAQKGNQGFAALAIVNLYAEGGPPQGWELPGSQTGALIAFHSKLFTKALVAYLDRWMIADRLGLDPLKGAGAMGQMAIHTLVFTIVALIMALVAMGAVWSITAQVLGTKAFGGLQEMLTGFAPSVGTAASSRARVVRPSGGSSSGGRR